MRGVGRVGAAVVALAILSVAFASAPAAARPVDEHAAAAARSEIRTLRLLTTSQSYILSRKRLRVRVGSRRSGTVRLFGSVRRGARGPLIVVTKVREVKVKAGRKRIVSLPVIKAGRRELGGCLGRRLTVHAALIRSTSEPPGRQAKNTRRVRSDRRRCERSSGGGGGGGTGGGGGSGGGGGPGEQRPVDFTTQNADRCDFIDGAHCLFPWPNDHFTTGDATTATRRRIDLNLQSMPRNRFGKPIDSADYNRNDGFSPGQKIVTKVPGLESKEAFSRTGAVPITDMGRGFDRRQPVVVINARTRARHMVWAEIDSNPLIKQNPTPADVNLIIRPGVNFEEGGRYIVALRDMRDAQGRVIPANAGFRIYRDRTLTTNNQVEARRAHFEDIFRRLAEAGIDRDDLYRAWDFTVASEKNLSERMLSIRDDAFRQLGDANLADLEVQGGSPPFVVTGVENDPAPQLARRVHGRFFVPCYLNAPGCPSGSRFAFPPGSGHGPPVAIPGNMMEARFQCNIPKVARDGPAPGVGPTPARASLYGHGLLGSRAEANQGQLRDFGNEHNIVFCATDWVGMSCADLPSLPTDGSPPRPEHVENIIRQTLAGNPPVPNCDIPNVATILQDLSNFPTLADRVQQGMLNFTYLGRLMVHPGGFNTHDAFRTPAGVPMLDTARLFYDGNSQGGIIGGALAAIAPDHERAVLGVPGMNYSTLLRRSVDFDFYATFQGIGLYHNYPNELERPLIISLIQMLWDRAEANGYAHHMTSDPLPNTPAHEILLHLGLGDHQVAQVTAEVEARTIGARVRQPYADPGRDTDVVPVFGAQDVPGYPWGGSALVNWDIGPLRPAGECNRDRSEGTPPPPTENVPPRCGEDPHEYPRREPSARVQKSEFLKVGGQLIDVCGPRPCYAHGWTGP